MDEEGHGGYGVLTWIWPSYGRPWQDEISVVSGGGLQGGGLQGGGLQGGCGFRRGA